MQTIFFQVSRWANVSPTNSLGKPDIPYFVLFIKTIYSIDHSRMALHQNLQ